jgi:hypothetical protein
LLAKGDYDKVLDFLNKNEASFGMILDKRKLVFKVLVKKGDNLSAINELVSIVKSNYENVKGEFQSIYDHHEILISMLINLAKEKGVAINLEFVVSELDN